MTKGKILITMKFAGFQSFLETLHFHTDKDIHLRCILEWELFEQWRDKSSDDHRLGLCLEYTTRHQVEQCILVDLADTRLMGDNRIIRGDTDIWDSIRDRPTIEYESITVDL